MPLRNELFGVFKLAKVNMSGNMTTTLISKASKQSQMEVKQQNYIQGTAESRILDIGLLTETISVDAPILVGGAAAIDGRSLLLGKITEAAGRDNTSLPLLQSGSITISSETGGNVSLKLRSDGDTVNPTFSIENATSAPSELDPDVNPSRVARNYDFKVRFGPYVAYVQNATINVEVETQQTQFLIPYTPVAGEDRMGTQYPYLGVAGIRINGTGTAAVNVGVTNDPQILGQGVTIQETPNVTTSTVQSFELLIGDDPLLGDIDIGKSVINSTDFNVSTNLLTVNFGFTSWVKIG